MLILGLNLKMKTIGYLNILLIFLSGCGRFSSSEGNGGGYGLLSSLPGITDPVAGLVNQTALQAGGRSSSRNVNSPVASRNGSGIRLSDWSKLLWDSGKSEGLCQTGSLLTGFISQAATSDRAVCYLKGLEGKRILRDFYDGKERDYRILTKPLDTFQSPELMIQFAVSAVKGRITEFKAKIGRDVGNRFERSFVNYSFKNSDELDIEMVSSLSYDPYSSYQVRTKLNGRKNSVDEWTTKEVIHGGHFLTWADGSQGLSVIRRRVDYRLLLNQFVDAMNMKGYFNRLDRDQGHDFGSECRDLPLDPRFMNPDPSLPPPNVDPRIPAPQECLKSATRFISAYDIFTTRLLSAFSVGEGVMKFFLPSGSIYSLSSWDSNGLIVKPETIARHYKVVVAEPLPEPNSIQVNPLMTHDENYMPTDKGQFLNVNEDISEILKACDEKYSINMIDLYRELSRCELGG